MTTQKKFTSKDGKHTITTGNPREQVTLRAQGYREVAAPVETPADAPGADDEGSGPVGDVPSPAVVINQGGVSKRPAVKAGK